MQHVSSTHICSRCFSCLQLKQLIIQFLCSVFTANCNGSTGLVLFIGMVYYLFSITLIFFDNIFKIKCTCFVTVWDL